MIANDLGFRHRFEAGTDERFTLLALHGTGGDENDMVPLARSLAPEAAILSPRGKVLENGMPRYFRRLSDGVFDEADLIERTHEMARFVREASARYAFDPERVVAVGYSNGANLAASLLLLDPGAVAGAVLFRAMPPIQPPAPPDLSKVRAFIAAGRHDPYSRRAEDLSKLLTGHGAKVDLRWLNAGHELTPTDVELAHEWLDLTAIRS